MQGDKEEWPECVGQSGEQAKQLIQAENPQLTVHILEEGSMCTMDYNTERVRIFVDANNNVSQVPRLG